ncbi:MAG: Rid family hydrolase, partial [Gammaproteobacteria bacterium]|nr:Rid family hydrolase [Gammaproteobacteria bacterium]
MVKMSTSGGGRFEKIGSYVRAKRVGPFVFVAGTTAIQPSGKLHAPGDTYAQTIYAFERIADA